MPVWPWKRSRRGRSSASRHGGAGPAGRRPPILLRLEPLEDRVLLAVTASIQNEVNGAILEVGLSKQGDAATLSVVGSALQVAGMSVDGAYSHSFSLSSFQGIDVEGNDTATGGEQSVILQNVVALAGELTTNAITDLTVNGSYLAAGGVELEADGTLTLAASATLSTRQIAQGADPSSAALTGNSGAISLESPSISLGTGSQLLAQVNAGSPFHAGNVTLEAADSSLRQATVVAPIDANSLTGTINVTGATISGADVEIKSEAKVEEAYENWGDYSDKLGETIFNFLNQVQGLAISSLTGISGEVIVRQSNASIDLASSTITASEGVTVESEAVTNSSFHTVSVEGIAASKAPFAVSIGYGEGHSTATTTMTGTTITAGDAVNITSDAQTEDTAMSRTTSNIQEGPANPNSVALAVAVANTSETSNVSVSPDSTVTLTGGGINTDATGDVTNYSYAEPLVYQDGTVALAVAIDYDKANIKTEVDGTLDASGGISNAFGAAPGGGVNYANGTITIPDHGFEDGEAVTYSNGGAPDIGGLQDGQTYYVQYVDGNTIRLSGAPTLNLGYTRPAQYASDPTQTLGMLEQLNFNPSAVNTKTGTITFPSPHGLADGQAVTYEGTASATDSTGAETNRDVAPLQQGQTYYVKWLSATAIQLTATPGGAPIVLTDAGVGTHSLLAQNHATTQSFDPATAVNSDSNTITFSQPDGFQTGDAVLYYTDPKKQLNGSITLDSGAPLTDPTLTAPDPPIGELQDGGLYYVVRIDAYTIRLVSSKAAALLAVPIALTQANRTGVGLGSSHSLVPVGYVNGVNIHAGLDAVNAITAETAVQSEAYGVADFLTEAPTGAADAIFGGIAGLGLAGINSIIKSFGFSPASEALFEGAAGAGAGAIGIDYFDHCVEAIVGATADIRSSQSINVAADIEEYESAYVDAGASKPETDEAAAVVAAGIGINLCYNTAKATVDGGAHLDAADAIEVEAETKYPFLVDSPLDAINPAEYLKTIGPEGWGYFMDGTLGIASNLFNTFVATEAGDGSVAIGGSVAFNSYTNDTEATIGAGAEINQDPAARFHGGQQTVGVAADTEMNLIQVLGVGGLGFSIDGLTDGIDSIEEGVGTKDKLLSARGAWPIRSERRGRRAASAPRCSSRTSRTRRSHRSRPGPRSTPVAARDGRAPSIPPPRGS